jgi:leucyl-tRNA synthetase
MAVENYCPDDIERKWQVRWDQAGVFRAGDESFPSQVLLPDRVSLSVGQGLHCGHPRPYIGMDIIAPQTAHGRIQCAVSHRLGRFRPAHRELRHPDRHPPGQGDGRKYRTFIAASCDAGMSFDYSREVNTTDPAYYKWTQWIFLRLFERGLAYKAEMPINYCPDCRVGLANRKLWTAAANDAAARWCAGQEPVDAAHYRLRPEAAGRLDGVDFIERSRRSRATGSAAARAPRWIS